MKELLESGVHFGHQTRRWDPKMKPFIYTTRNGIHIIDLQKTVEKGEIAYQYIIDTVKEGGKVLFVGTKKQAQEAIKREAERCNQFYVTHRWLGGMLTNFKTIQNSIHRLKKLEKMEVDGTFEALTKKEVLNLSREKEKLDKNLGGIKEMNTLPDILFVIDPRKEYIAVNEARKLNIPVIAVVDTNCDPNIIDYPIPGNDDAIRAINLFAKIVADAVLEGETIAGKEMAENIAENIATAEAEKAKHEEETTEEEAKHTDEETISKNTTEETTSEKDTSEEEISDKVSSEKKTSDDINSEKKHSEDESSTEESEDKTINEEVKE
jgi:small subunit ribosomal protein S2